MRDHTKLTLEQLQRWVMMRLEWASERKGVNTELFAEEILEEIDAANSGQRDAALERAERAEKDLSEAREEWRDFAEDFGLSCDLSPRDIRRATTRLYYDMKKDRDHWRYLAARKEKTLTSIREALSASLSTKP